MPVNVSFYMKCIKAECIFLMAAETATSNALAECVCAARAWEANSEWNSVNVRLEKLWPVLWNLFTASPLWFIRYDHSMLYSTITNTVIIYSL